jgi:hypothetical protein
VPATSKRGARPGKSVGPLLPAPGLPTPNSWRCGLCLADDPPGNPLKKTYRFANLDDPIRRVQVCQRCAAKVHLGSLGNAIVEVGGETVGTPVAKVTEREAEADRVSKLPKGVSLLSPPGAKPAPEKNG